MTKFSKNFIVSKSNNKCFSNSYKDSKKSLILKMTQSNSQSTLKRPKDNTI